MIELYAEYGIIGVVVILFSYMIMNLMKSQKEQEREEHGLQAARAPRGEGRGKGDTEEPQKNRLGRCTQIYLQGSKN